MIYHIVMMVVWYGCLIHASEEQEALLSKQGNKKIKEHERPFFDRGIRSFFDFFQHSIQNLGNWTYQTHKDEITIKMMEKRYIEIKQYIDTNYKDFILCPTKFDVNKLCMRGSGDMLHTMRRRNSREFVEAVDRSRRNSELHQKELTAMIQTVYKKSFKKMNRFSDNFTKNQELFLKEYSCAEKAFEEKDFIEAYAAIVEAEKLAKESLWYLTHQKEEQMTINEMSECTNSPVQSTRNTHQEGYNKEIRDDENMQGTLFS